MLAHVCLNYKAREDTSSSTVSISVISAAWRKLYTGCNLFQMPHLISMPEVPTPLPGQHMFPYVHHSLLKYFILCCKLFLLSFIHMSCFYLKLNFVHNIIWLTKLMYSSRLKMHSGVLPDIDYSSRIEILCLFPLDLLPYIQELS
jgi:hypothetical protein